MSIIARINITIENNDKSEFFSLVSTVGANIEDVMENNVGKYLDSLKRFLMSKQNNGPYQQLLNHGDIQEIVDQVNHSIGNRLNFQKIEAIRKVNVSTLSHLLIPWGRSSKFEITTILNIMYSKVQGEGTIFPNFYSINP